MDMLVKTCPIKALDEEGRGVAVIATLGVVDHDNDVTLPGAFGEQIVPMVPAHDWRQAPIGKAVVREVENEAIAEFVINRKTSLGQDWYEALRFDFTNPPPKQQYSYGFTIRDKGFRLGEQDGKQVRFLTSLEVHEISPVLLGAGINTRTLALKEHEPKWTVADHIEHALFAVDSLIERLEFIHQFRADEGREISKSRQRALYAMKEKLARLNERIDRFFDQENKIRSAFFDQELKRLQAQRAPLGHK